MSSFAGESNSTNSQIIPVDTEHLGIRLFVPIVTVASLVGGYILGAAVLNLVLPNASGICLGIPMALIFTAVILQIVEKIVKPRWHSGRHIVLDDQLALVDTRRGKNKSLVFNWTKSTDVVAWYFEVHTKRKSRVPQGWYCTSLRLVQEDTTAIIYTFMSPEDAREMAGFSRHFTLLERQKSGGLSQANLNKTDKQQKRQASGRLSQASLNKTDFQLSAQQRRLRNYENERWEDGAEVASEDFLRIIATVFSHAIAED